MLGRGKPFRRAWGGRRTGALRGGYGKGGTVKRFYVSNIAKAAAYELRMQPGEPLSVDLRDGTTGALVRSVSYRTAAGLARCNRRVRAWFTVTPASETVAGRALPSRIHFEATY